MYFLIVVRHDLTTTFVLHVVGPATLMVIYPSERRSSQAGDLANASPTMRLDITNQAHGGPNWNGNESGKQNGQMFQICIRSVRFVVFSNVAVDIWVTNLVGYRWYYFDSLAMQVRCGTCLAIASAMSSAMHPLRRCLYMYSRCVPNIRFEPSTHLFWGITNGIHNAGTALTQIRKQSIKRQI